MQDSKQLVEDNIQAKQQQNKAGDNIRRSEEKLVSYLPDGKTNNLLSFFHPSKDSSQNMFKAMNVMFYANLHMD